MVRVQDVAGGAIAGAVVTLGDTMVGTTDADGALFVDPQALDLPAAGDILASAEGYDQAQRFYVSPGAVTLKLVAEGRIEGIVLEEATGKTLASVQVSRGFEDQVQSGPDGRFVMHKVPPGAHHLRGQAQGWFGATDAPVTIGPATVATGVVIEMSRGYTIRGKVTAGGEPMAGAHVGGAETGAVTDAEGRYALHGVPPGTHTIGLGFADPSEMFYTVGSSTSVTVVDRDVQADLEVQARATVIVEAVDQAGRPQEGVRFHITQGLDRHQVSSPCLTNAEGRCSKSGLLPTFVLVDMDDGPSRKVHLPTPGNQPIRFVTRPAAVLAGRVVNADGRPVGPRVVWIENAAADYRTNEETAANGTFRFPRVPPGDYTLEVRADVSIRRGEAAEAASTVTVPRSARVEDVKLVVSAETGHIAGEVVDGAAAPVRDALVICGRRGWGNGEDRTVTDTRGRFRCAGLRPQYKYTIRAHGRDGASTVVRDIAVGTTSARLQLSRPVTLRVEVMGAPAVNVGCELEGPDGDSHTAASALGGFHFVGLEPDMYTLTVRAAPRYEPRTYQIRVDARPVQSYTVTMDL